MKVLEPQSAPQSSLLPTLKRRVHFYECDMMGVMHHSNYLRVYEEARVNWAFSLGLMTKENPHTAARFAVLETWVKHLKPLRFDDEFEVRLQSKLSGIRIVLEYKLCIGENQTLSVARTVHAPLDQDLKLVRWPEPIKEILERQIWNETWLSSL
jgi:acyl-CoA thioester hydrolase